MEIDPNTITVYGPEQIVSQVDKAWVSVQLEDISKTVEEMMTFTLMDAAGHEVSSDMLTFSQDTVRVHIQVNMLKELPLEVLLTRRRRGRDKYDPHDLARLDQGLRDAETLEEYNKITLGTVDLGSFLVTTTETFPILLPDGVTNLTGLTSATVTLSVTGLEWEQVTTTNVKQENLPPGYTADILTNSLDIKIRGMADELERVSDADIRVVADLSDLKTTGTFSVIAKVYVDGDFTSVGAIGVYKVTVSVSETPT
jgi:YbbR domain-containing protein